MFYFSLVLISSISISSFTIFVVFSNIYSSVLVFNPNENSAVLANSVANVFDTSLTTSFASYTASYTSYIAVFYFF